MTMFDDTIGAALIGTLLSVFLGGITAAQSFTYYASEHRRTDRLVYRLIVGFLFIIDIFQSILVCHIVYHWTITNFTNPIGIGTMPWSLVVEPSITGITGVVCQTFFAYRVYVVAGRKIIIPLVIVGLSLLSGGFAIATSVWAQLVVHAQLARAGEFRWGVGIWLLTAAATDLLITGSLIYYLRKASSGDYSRSSSIVDKILRNTVETNGITLVVAVIDAILYLALPETAHHLIANFLLVKLLTNSVLVSLNSRGALASVQRSQQHSGAGSSPFMKAGMFSRSQANGADDQRKGVSHISFTKHQVTHTESVSDDKEAEPGIVHPFARSASLSSMNKEHAVELGTMESSPHSNDTVRAGATQAAWNSTDFAQLREALLNQPGPSRLPILDRDDVLQAHNALVARERALADEVRTRKAVVGPGKHFSSIERLEDLKRVGLDPTELRTDEIAGGKALVCRIASAKSVRTVGLHLVVEDSKGRLAPLQLHHLPSRDLADAYAIGMYFAIKEPNVRSSRDGFLIRVESPADIVRLYPSSPLLEDLPFPPPRHLPIVHRTAAQHKDDGNRLFGAGRFDGARDAYSLALDTLSSQTDPLRVALLANRAAVLLKLGLQCSALADSTLALTLDPLTPLRLKLLYRASSACYALQRYEDCSAQLDELLRLSPEDKDGLDLQRRLHLRLAERDRGQYDWPALFKTAARAEELDVVDYVGGMFEVRDIKGKGRGLVATRTIEPGELLMVQKPLAMGRGDLKGKKKSIVVGANLYTETMDPPSTSKLVAHLAERMMDDESIRSRTLELYAGEDQSQITTAGIDISRLEAIATWNAFHTESLAQKSKSLSPADDRAQLVQAPSSLYGLPSMLNHSCVGNVSYSFLADTFFLRARLPIAPGDELVDSYVDSLEGLAKRADKLEKHRFVCICALCEMDRADGQAAGRERERLAEQLEELTDRIHGQSAQDPAPLLPTMRSFIDKISATYSPNRPTLRPALYPAYRLLAATLSTLGRFEEAITTELKALASLGAVFEGTGESVKVVKVPKLGDVNAVLSSLFIALQHQELGRSPEPWLRIARRIERGQAGEEVFEARYTDWTRKNKLEL